VAGPNANQVRQDPPNPLAYHTRLPLPFYGNSPESSQAGRSSISARLGGLGGISGWGLDAGIIFHADKLSRN
jgi:hypothetical protein